MKSLYIKQKVFKITDHYPITDEHGNIVYQVDQDFRLVGNTVHVSSADGRHLFTIDKVILSLLPKFTVQFANGQEIAIKSNFTLFHRDIDIDPDHLGLNLKGDFWGHEYTLSQSGRIVGSISKKWLTWGDTYQLDIHDEELEELFVAVVIAVDHLIDMARSS